MSQEVHYRSAILIPPTQLVSRAANLLGTPSGAILHLAAEKVARDRGGRLDSRWADAGGTLRECLLAVRTPQFPRGLGIEVDGGGAIRFRYDAHGAPGAGEALCAALVQAYTVIAVLRSQQARGFEVTLEEIGTENERRVIVRGHCGPVEAVRIVVEPHGGVLVDFVGYAGSVCEIEAEKLRHALVGFGLRLAPERVRAKSLEEQAAERDGLDNAGSREGVAQ